MLARGQKLHHLRKLKALRMLVENIAFESKVGCNNKAFRKPLQTEKNTEVDTKNMATTVGVGTLLKDTKKHLF